MMVEHGHAAEKLSQAEARVFAQEAYLVGLPLVYIAVQADVQTNVAKPEPGRDALAKSKLSAAITLSQC
jgi:hypothetical protein